MAGRSSMPVGARDAGAFQPDGLSPLRDQRIATREKFSEVLSARQSFSGHYLRVNHLQSKGEACLGLVVPKRLTGTSVQRNNLRRRLSEKFRIKSAELAGFDVVVTLRKPCLDKNEARAAAAEFDALLDKVASLR